MTIRGAGRYSTLITPTAGSLFHAEFHADLACMGAGLVTPLFGDTRDSRAWRDTLQQGCHAADAIRARINEILARAAREGSGVVVRNSGSPSSLTTPAHSR